MIVLPVVGRWLGRLASLGALGFVLLFVISDGVHGTLTPRERAMFAFLAIGLAGNLAAWRWEAIGAAFACAGLLGLTVIELTTNQRMPGVWFFILLGLPALFFFMSWLLRRNGVSGTV